MKKRFFQLGMMLFIPLFLIACSSQSTSTDETQHTTNATQNSSQKNESDAEHILIAYFSRSNHTKTIAEQIQQETGGDLYEITTVTPYPMDYDTILKQAKKEQEDQFRPQLANLLQNLDSYDIVFIGYPIGWSDMPMPVYTFIEALNFQGKTVIPFCTSGGSGFSSTETKLQKKLNDAQMLKGFEVDGERVSQARNEVSAWLSEIGVK